MRGSFINASISRSLCRSLVVVEELGGSPLPAINQVTHNLTIPSSAKRHTFIIQNLAQKMKQRQALFSSRHRLHHQRRLRSLSFISVFAFALPILLRRPRKLYDTSELESHDGASYVAIGRFDDYIERFF